MRACQNRSRISRWREELGGTYRSWFLWEERLKNFCSIHRGLATVVEDIEKGTFGNVYKGTESWSATERRWVASGRGSRPSRRWLAASITECVRPRYGWLPYQALRQAIICPISSACASMILRARVRISAMLLRRSATAAI
ncbi:type II restriction enzyme [Corallococcus macrosporus DSM 14697]|uniref:Type II restriction enzyme n=1 Tax=Corallococcus macrosporus DSM 14697 TaxID=1189310 RepID=A0A250JSC6_9BACT|nr:type II restriction enzyme [Corallococcus macrosporus DSM 14697]